MAQTQWPTYWWTSLSDRELLELRFCDLNLKIAGSPLEKHIETLYTDLASKKLNFKPHVWISEEWFAADGIPGIAIPFYLLHPRLTRLHRRQGQRIEGISDGQFLRLLRHEAGHAIDNAFCLRKSRNRQIIFGLSSTPYPDAYSPRIYSKKYVRHLDLGYAQAHPDEDWAETFAVWLNPKSNWQEKYKTWPAFNKLLFMDATMNSLNGKTPVVQNRRTLCNLSTRRQKLFSFYNQKQSEQRAAQTRYLKPLLPELFTPTPRSSGQITAANFILKERGKLRKSIASSSNHPQYKINFLINNLVAACRTNKLHLRRSQRQTKIDLVGVLGAQAEMYLRRGHHEVPM